MTRVQTLYIYREYLSLASSMSIDREQEEERCSDAQLTFSPVIAVLFTKQICIGLMSSIPINNR